MMDLNKSNDKNKDSERVISQFKKADNKGNGGYINYQNLINYNSNRYLNNNISTIKDENKINDKNESLIINNKNSFSDLNMNIYMTNNDNKTQSISLFEKEYNCILKNENYSIKLYFTNFFRNNNKNNKDIENNEGNNLSNEKYINFIKNEILKYIK